MKILLDECIDRRFAIEFPEHEVKTVPQMGWAGIKNGTLMKLAEGSFDVFVTVDRNLAFQQTSQVTILPSSSSVPSAIATTIWHRSAQGFSNHLEH